MPEEQRPTPESLRTFIQTEWADIHHSRVQEWTALGIVAGVHLILVQIVVFLSEEQPLHPPKFPMVMAAFLAAAFAVFGILITFRHRHLMKVKLNWIFQAEERLGLIQSPSHDGIIPIKDALTEQLPWKGLARPRPLSTSGLIVGFYGLLIVVDILVAKYFGLL